MTSTLVLSAFESPVSGLSGISRRFMAVGASATAQCSTLPGEKEEFCQETGNLLGLNCDGFQKLTRRALEWRYSAPAIQGGRCELPYRRVDAAAPVADPARPQMPFTVEYGLGSFSGVALVDSGADAVALPLSYARALGVDLSKAARWVPIWITLSAITPSPTQRRMPPDPLYRDRRNPCLRENTDTTFTSGAPLLKLLEPTLLLPLLAGGLLVLWLANRRSWCVSGFEDRGLEDGLRFGIHIKTPGADATQAWRRAARPRRIALCRFS
jgi:hypothetical protein